MEAVEKTEHPPAGRPIPLALAAVPVLALVGLLGLVILWLPRVDSSFEGSGHLPLLLAAGIGGVLARLYGWRWDTIQTGILQAIHLSMGAMLILVIIGALIGTWIAAGIVPAFISWGLALLRPSYFLAACCFVCSIVSVVSGSSWSTAGTVGIAMLGVGNALEISPALTAGAIISGAYFGDKLSPLSDTTNLAPAMAGTDLFTHIRHMLWTTVPSWLIAMIGFTIITSILKPSGNADSVQSFQVLIQEHFSPSWIHLLVPILVVVLAVSRFPPLPTLALASLLGGGLALSRGQSLSRVLSAAMSGYRATTGNAALDSLLSRGGLTSMMNTVLLILSAMVFGGTMESTGMLQTLADTLLAMAHSNGSLVLATILTSIATNVLTADQYIAIVLPGRMYAPSFAARGLDPKHLSRALEDGGTMTSVLIPWNTCGAFMSTTLGIATGRYFPYCFMNLVNPIVGVINGFRIRSEVTDAKRQPEG